MIRRVMRYVVSIITLVGLAAPATAPAQQLRESGVPLSIAASYRATSTNTQMTTAVGTVECAKVTLQLVVTENSTVVSRSETGFMQTTGCKITKGGGGESPVTITGGSVDFALLGSGSGLVDFAFTSDIPEVPIPCHWTGSAGPMSYTTNSSTVTVSVSMASFQCGLGNLTGTFTLETLGGQAITIS